MDNVKLQDIQDRLGSFRLNDSLQFLRHLLSVTRGERVDKELANLIATQELESPAFVVHFMVKQLLLISNNIATRTLNGPAYLSLQDMFFSLRDPIQDDPNWGTLA